MELLLLHREPTQYNWRLQHKWLLISAIVVCSYTNGVVAQNLSPSEAADSARQVTDGKVLKVKPINGDTIHYRVKILSPEGRIRYIVIDGNNGSLHPRPPHTHHYSDKQARKKRKPNPQPKPQPKPQQNNYTETGL
ncbi:PepSY domain-containing protein [Eionea flava]